MERLGEWRKGRGSEEREGDGLDLPLVKAMDEEMGQHWGVWTTMWRE